MKILVKLTSSISTLDGLHPYNFLVIVLTLSVLSLSPCGRVAEPTCWRCGEGGLEKTKTKKFQKRRFLDFVFKLKNILNFSKKIHRKIVKIN
jgi:hypothetical protein